MSATSSQSAPATGLLVPQLHPDIPHVYADDTKDASIIQALIGAKLLKKTDLATSLDEHASIALHRLKLPKYLDDLGSVWIETDGDKGPMFYGKSYPPEACIGYRICIAPLLTLIPAEFDLVEWFIWVINTHPLIVGPERWESVIKGYYNEVELAKEFDIEDYVMDWLDDDKQPVPPESDDDAMLARIKHKQLAAIMRILCIEARRAKREEGVLKCISDRCWCVCQWQSMPERTRRAEGYSPHDLIAHMWDAEFELDQEGGMGDSGECLAFGGTIDRFIKEADEIYTQVTTVTKLLDLSWKLKYNPATGFLSPRHYWSTVMDPRQLSLDIKSVKGRSCRAASK